MKHDAALAVTGAVVVVIALIAFTNLQEIYNSQKVFVVGLLAFLAGFSFAKAFSRATQERPWISSAKPGRSGGGRRRREGGRADAWRPGGTGPAGSGQRVAAAPGPAGFFENIALLERNIEAAQDRISEYYHAQAQNLNFHENAPLLRVVLDDLDNISVNAVRLRRRRAEAARPKLPLMTKRVLT